MENNQVSEAIPQTTIIPTETIEPLKAEIIYVVLKKSCYVSRSLRVQWYLQHLNTKIRISHHSETEDDDVEAAVVSVVPEEPSNEWTPENSHLFEYLVTLSTNVIFLGEVYRLVFCLDISPSVSTVDSQQGEVLLDVIIDSLQESIKLLINSFVIPGSSHLFKPDIFITVIAHTPFYITPAQQVLVQGWKLSKDNVNDFLEAVLRQLEFIEDTVARVSASIHEQLESERKRSAELKRMEGNVYEKFANHPSPITGNIPMVSPASGFLNLLRFGMLALKLLPPSNFSDLVVITDGMIIMPDIDTLDSVLNHMRYNDIACNFIHVGSLFHPHCGIGFVPYSEIMQLISVATNGCYLQFPAQNKQLNGINVYQKNFLMWSLKRKSVISELSTPHPKDGEWTITNPHFYGNRGPQLLPKKYLESDINVTLYGVLACRIREGFILDEMFIKENELVITFILPWTNHIYIEYIISCQWPVVVSPSICTHYTINIKAPYEFLHDISCRNKAPIKSPFRQALIARFWRSLKSFSQSDSLLSHLESFMNNVSSYYLPESLKSGVPLYYLAHGTCQPAITSNDIGFTQFGTIWRPACLLNNNLWLKWFHTERVGIILKHDELLNLFFQGSQPASIKYKGVQCRLATNTLFNFLKTNSSFILIENHSFIKFLLPSESGTGKCSFYVVRSICKPPYAVLHIAFLYNIPGSVRYKLLNDFKRSVSALKIARPIIQKDSSFDLYNVDRYDNSGNCCVILEKPLEKILIRYEQMPSEFNTVIFPDGTQSSNKSPNPLSSNRGLITTLSRYLHHRRWVWKANVTDHIFLPLNTMKTVLSTLVKIRLHEGFHFAHFSGGICNMVLEVQMKGTLKDKENSDGLYYDYRNDDDNEELYSCIIQYVLFPPRTIEIRKEGEDENYNRRGEVVELISECWIEPQNGVITGCPTTRSYMSNLQYHQLPDAIWAVDAKCISALFTFEHLCLMCSNPSADAPESIQDLLIKSNSVGSWPNVAPFQDQRISHINFAYSVPNLLCQSVQENLQFNLFSIDVLDKSENTSEPNKLLLDSIFNHLSTVHQKELIITGQDAEYLIRNFRRHNRNSDKRNADATAFLDIPERVTHDTLDVVPTAKDWERMTLWATGRRDSSDSTVRATVDETEEKKRPAPENASCSRSSVHYVKHDSFEHTEPGGRFRKSIVSDFNESHHSSNFDLSSISNLENADWLKWKCYIKLVSNTQCIVTLLPESLEVIKRITLDHEQRNSQITEPHSFSHIVSESVSAYFDVDSQMTAAVDGEASDEALAVSQSAAGGTANNVKNDSSSMYTSCSLSSKDFETEDTICDDENADLSTELSKEQSIVAGGGEIITSSFRLRASTWDPVRRVMDSHITVDDRLRTNSVGARVRPLSRLRPKRSFDFESKEKLSYPESAARMTKYVPLVLPVYVYNCCLQDVIDYLIYRDESMVSEERFFESKRHERPSLEWSNSDLDSSHSTLVKKYQEVTTGRYNLDEQCQSIDTTFTKFFILSLFKCLHQGYEIPVSDVEQAFSKCETSVLTIDITDYLKAVCRHLRTLGSNPTAEDEKPKISTVNIYHSGLCNELRFIHRLIKRKFANILTSDFRPILSKPEFYYFFPSWTKESKPSSAGILSPGLVENNSNATSVEHIIPVSAENILGINTWEACKESLNSEDNACTSLISNMDSDSLNEISNESLMDDANPLFLRVDCKIFSNNKIGKCSLHVIPTCICEILKHLDTSFQDINVNDLRVTLDLLCLTSPFIDAKKKPAKFANSSDIPSKSGGGVSSYFSEDAHKISEESTEGLLYEEGKIPRQIMSLPEYQYNALNTCVSQMKWLIKDEIITFMLDTSPVTSDNLKMVCEHIEASPNAATCFIEKVPLSFVFSKETTSVNNFLKAFDNMKIPHYHLKKEENMYYLVKDKQNKNAVFLTENLDDSEFIGDNSKLFTSSMEILNEEQENFFQVFSSNDSISENESVKIVNTLQRQESITDPVEDSSRMLQNTVKWILERESKDTELPNFWLIMTITDDYVIVYFHCRFLEINKKEIKDYVLVRETVISNIKNLCKIVNQKMLLSSLHDTRICDQLLEPDSQNEDGDTDIPSIVTETNHTFVPGCFACNVVWETKFILHPRLKMNPIKSGLSRGIQALCSALGGFSVTNRKNLFVYEDVEKQVFYLRLFESTHGFQKSQESEETSSGSFSRSSSFTSLNRRQFEEQLSVMSEEAKTRNKSISDASESNFSSSRSEDHISLKIYGIVEPGTDIKNELVQVLQNRFDDAVLEVISIMLSRNPLCKLLSEDVHFIQKPYQNPNTVLQFRVDDWVLKYLQTFRYLIQQNIQLFATLPKYSDPRPMFHFQDYSYPEDSLKRVGDHDIFLYNQNPTCGKGIACIAVALVDSNNEAVEFTDEMELSGCSTSEIPSLNELKLMTEVSGFQHSSEEERKFIKVEFRIWKQGRINMSVLEPKLLMTIRHALWELVMEKILLVYPIFEADTTNLFEAFHTLMPLWVNFATELNIASVRVWNIGLPIKCNLRIILKELNQVFPVHEIACYAFYKYSGDGSVRSGGYRPFTHFDEIMEHVGDTCLLMGRSMSWLQNALECSTSSSGKSSLEPINKSERLQRLPSTSQDDSYVSILRQKFILISITNSKITMHIYNWSKDKIDAIVKLTSNLSEWIAARSHLLVGIVEQKMGIFFNQPLNRSSVSKKISEIAKLDVDALSTFPITSNKSAETAISLYSVSESFKDVKIPKDVRSKIADKDLFCANMKQLKEAYNIDKKSRQKHLFSAWQNKGSSASTSVSEEMLNNFLTNGRFIHYCLTPLLFMPRWRIEAATTRDHSLSTQAQNESLVSHEVDEKWHSLICGNFIHEYKQYLQSLGFFPIQPSEEFSKQLNPKQVSSTEEDKKAHYMQKFSLGGVLLFELFFSIPFFYAKLYALDYALLKQKTNTLLSQFAVSFLDECDRIKFQMHLHSFTYDYHLRCLHQYITDQQPLLKHGYHVIEFLDDFMKYYPKAPNYARSLVHTESMFVNNVPIRPTQLFDYLLSNGKNYNMNAFCMIPEGCHSESSETNEYILIQNKNKSAVSYKDANDKQQTDDFDIIVITSHLKDSDESTMRFQIYILLTSRRELYPKVESETKLGKFRTVSTSQDYPPIVDDISIHTDGSSGSSSKESQDARDSRKRKSTSHHVEIKPELVNYLGYYSSHEEAMQKLMMEEVEEVKKYIEWMVTQGAFDCETHILWNKLLCSKPEPLTYSELQHLLTLADVFDISNMDSQLRHILNQPIGWFQSFVKALISKLPECCHLFSSPNGSTQELLILHPQYINGFVMIILNIQRSTVAMNLVYRKGSSTEDEAHLELQTLFEQIINTCCFHLWMDAF